VKATESERLRVAFFNASDRSSGAESLICRTVEGSIERGVDVRLYALRRETGASYVYPMPLFRGELRLEHKFRSLTGLNDLLFPSTWRLGYQPWLKSADVWHFHNLHGHYISIPLLAALSKKRLVVLSPVDQFLSTGYCPYTLGCERYRFKCGNCPQLDLPYPGISRDATSALLRMKKFAARKSEFNILVHTDFLAQYYDSTFIGQLPITRLHYGIDTRVFRPMSRDSCARALGVDASRRFVVGLFHSNVAEKRKGLLELLGELGALADQMPGQIEVLIVGHRSERATEHETTNLRLTTLPFLTSDHELAMALNLCDVLLYPTKAENLSLTCLNAMACGVPVISSAVGGQGEAIVDGRNGYLCDPNESAQFIQRIAQLVADKTLLRQLATEARSTVAARFDINSYVDNLIAYYRQLLKTKSSE
jgi:glycosyltransferase involved in cell wall biosynthesis